MGKGDIKTRRGKIVNGSYGRLRPKKSKKKAVVAAKPKAKAKPKAAAKKAPAKKKAAAKKDS